MSGPWETLKNRTHQRGVMGVIRPRHSAGNFQNESPSSSSTCMSPAVLYIFTGVTVQLQENVIEQNLIQQACHSPGRKCHSVSRREVNGGSLHFSCNVSVNTSAHGASFRVSFMERSRVLQETQLLTILRASDGWFVKGKVSCASTAVNVWPSCQQPCPDPDVCLTDL